MSPEYRVNIDLTIRRDSHREAYLASVAALSFFRELGSAKVSVSLDPLGETTQGERKTLREMRVALALRDAFKDLDRDTLIKDIIPPRTKNSSTDRKLLQRFPLWNQIRESLNRDERQALSRIRAVSGRYGRAVPDYFPKTIEDLKSVSKYQFRGYDDVGEQATNILELAFGLRRHLLNSEQLGA